MPLLLWALEQSGCDAHLDAHFIWDVQQPRTPKEFEVSANFSEQVEQS